MLKLTEGNYAYNKNIDVDDYQTRPVAKKQVTLTDGTKVPAVPQICILEKNLFFTQYIMPS